MRIYRGGKWKKTYHHLDRCFFHTKAKIDQFIDGLPIRNGDFPWLGGLEQGFYFPIILGMSSSQLTNSYFFRGVGIPPTRYDLTSESEDFTRGYMDKKTVSFYQLASQIPAGWLMNVDEKKASAHEN